MRLCIVYMFVYTVCALIFVGVLFHGFPIFADLAFLNLWLLDTVVFKYSQLKYVIVKRRSICFVHYVLSSSFAQSGFPRSCCHQVRNDFLQI